MKLRCSAIWSDAVIRVTAIAHLLNFTQKQGPVENFTGTVTCFGKDYTIGAAPPSYSSYF